MNSFAGRHDHSLFDAKGIILQHWVFPQQIISGEYYATVLKWDFRNAIRKKRRDFLGKKWFLIQDNARPHTAKEAMNELTKVSGTPLAHLSYSPDVAPFSWLEKPKNCMGLCKNNPHSETIRNGVMRLFH